MAPNSRFQSVIFLDEPDGCAKELSIILGESHPGVHFLCPPIPTHPTGFIGFTLATIRLLPLIQSNPKTLLIGKGFGGLLAAMIQERHPQLDLSVIAINAPTHEDGMGMSWSRPRPSLIRDERVVLYSSQYKPLQDADLWLGYADLVFDVPWLAEGVQKALHATSYVISAFMRGLDLRKEIASLFPSI